MVTMNYLKLAKEDFLGAGDACVKRVDYLVSKGVNAKLIVFHKTTDNPNVIGMYSQNSFWGRLGIKITKRIVEMYKKRHFKVANNKYEMINMEIGIISANHILSLYGDIPDVIDVSWVSDFVTTKTIQKLKEITGARIVYTMNDSAHYTGGCHYPWDCKGFERNCFPCPALFAGDRTAEITLRKKQAHIPKGTVLIGSKYDCERAKESILFKDGMTIMPSIKVSANPYYYDKSVGRDKWRIPSDHTVIFFGASNTAYERKGFKELLLALDYISNKRKLSDVTLLVAGKCDKKIDCATNIIYTGNLGQEDLFKAYYCADIYLSPSLEDSGPVMLKYAFMANIPVVCFPVGYAIDLIKHKQNGYVAEWRSPEDFGEGIMYWLDADNLKLRSLIECNKNIVEMLKKRLTLDKYLGIEGQ